MASRLLPPSPCKRWRFLLRQVSLRLTRTREQHQPPGLKHDVAQTFNRSRKKMLNLGFYKENEKEKGKVVIPQSQLKRETQNIDKSLLADVA